MLKDSFSNFTRILAILSVVLISISIGEVQAEGKCNCPPKPNIAADLKKSSVVFLGQVVEVRPQFPLHVGHYYIRFLPMKRFKGLENYPNPENIVVYAPISSDPCSFRFIKGNDYLVFADGNPAFLKTNSCSNTGIQEDRSQEIFELNNITKK